VIVVLETETETDVTVIVIAACVGHEGMEIIVELAGNVVVSILDIASIKNCRYAINILLVSICE
jgi:hypothetical protein